LLHSKSLWLTAAPWCRLGKQGSVYSTIIEEVINSSRIDFEEAGINVSTLDDLKQVSNIYLLKFCRIFECWETGGFWAAVVGCCLFDLVLSPL
jgi:hypothetical protein